MEHQAAVVPSQAERINEAREIASLIASPATHDHYERAVGRSASRLAGERSSEQRVSIDTVRRVDYVRQCGRLIVQYRDDFVRAA